MADYTTIEGAVAAASRDNDCSFTQIKGKKIMYEGRLRDGRSIIMCTPQAKRQAQGFFWTDITAVQCQVLDAYDKAVIVFRLEGGLLVSVSWGTLNKYLTRDCMKYNANEGNHWKLNIYEDRIKITGNPREVPLVAASPKKKFWDFR